MNFRMCRKILYSTSAIRTRLNNFFFGGGGILGRLELPEIVRIGCILIMTALNNLGAIKIRHNI